MDEAELRVGDWARSGGLLGLVVRADDDSLTLFDPGERHRAEVARADAQRVPAGAVTVSVTVDLPLPHGVDEPVVRRWVASLTDETVRERAYAALAEAGLDEGPALPGARVDVRPVDGGLVCLCGARLPGPPGGEATCPSCGRRAVGAPVGNRPGA